jgi:hypothetical protein
MGNPLVGSRVGSLTRQEVKYAAQEVGICDTCREVAASCGGLRLTCGCRTEELCFSFCVQLLAQPVINHDPGLTLGIVEHILLFEVPIRHWALLRGGKGVEANTRHVGLRHWA